MSSVTDSLILCPSVDYPYVIIQPFVSLYFSDASLDDLIWFSGGFDDSTTPVWSSQFCVLRTDEQTLQHHPYQGQVNCVNTQTL